MMQDLHNPPQGLWDQECRVLNCGIKCMSPDAKGHQGYRVKQHNQMKWNWPRVGGGGGM